MNGGWKSIRFVITSTRGGSRRRLYGSRHSAAESDDICSNYSEVSSVFNRFLKNKKSRPLVINDSYVVAWHPSSDLSFGPAISQTRPPSSVDPQLMMSWLRCFLLHLCLAGWGIIIHGETLKTTWQILLPISVSANQRKWTLQRSDRVLILGKLMRVD